MMNDIPVRYVSSAGRAFVLQGDGRAFLDVFPLFHFSWDYELVNSTSGMGGAATNFARFPKTVELELRLRGYDRQGFLDKINELHRVAEPDLVSATPGRLYLGDQYMVCYLTAAGGVSSAPRNGHFATQALTVLAVRPFWCREVEFQFVPQSGGGEVENDMAKKYNLRYPYRYNTGLNARQLYNNFYLPTPMIITIQGPASTPAIQIGSNVYRVNAQVLATEYLVIDQPARQIYTVGETGQRVNRFNDRDKRTDIFAPAPVGNSTVLYNGDFVVSIRLVQQRSAPEWTE